MRHILYAASAAVCLVQGSYSIMASFANNNFLKGVRTTQEQNQLSDEIKCPENSDLNVFNQCICDRESVR